MTRGKQASRDGRVFDFVVICSMRREKQTTSTYTHIYTLEFDKKKTSMSISRVLNRLMLSTQEGFTDEK